MKKIFIIFLACGSLQAALPPLFQSSQEIKALLSSPELSEKLESGEAIMEISRSEGGWRVKTNRHILDVQVKEEPQAMPGPIKFRLEFGSAVDSV